MDRGDDVVLQVAQPLCAGHALAALLKQTAGFGAPVGQSPADQGEPGSAEDRCIAIFGPLERSDVREQPCPFDGAAWRSGRAAGADCTRGDDDSVHELSV
jgi:hypothetical protein